MKCPKCSTKLRLIPAGYVGARAEDNCHAMPLSGHYSCWCCGYLQEINTPPALTIEIQPKQQYDAPVPVDRGDIRDILKARWIQLQTLRDESRTWPFIINQLELQEFDKTEVVKVYHRMRTSKQMNQLNKGARRV